jgi:hypothetical protein
MALVPQFLPPEHEPAHVQITQQRPDRRALWTTPTFIPISRTSTFISALIRFLDRSFQPHPDQMEHVPVYDPASSLPSSTKLRNRGKSFPPTGWKPRS